MRSLLAALSALFLAACATPPPSATVVDALFDEARYGKPPQPRPADLFALSPAMERFLALEMRSAVRNHGAQIGLVQALREGGRLRLDYDASLTRTAAEAFDARAGNCMSLVLMTAALAREMGLSVQFQLVEVPDIWTRSQHFTLLNGHVNLSLGSGARGGLWTRDGGRTVIDFQPVEEARLARVRPLSEEAVVAMFFNNRAVEHMEAGEWAAAHAALRVALQADPAHLNALNTLAVLHRRQGDLRRAEAALRTLLAHDPFNRHASSNLVAVLESQGRSEEARALARALPPPPFADFDRGLKLAAQGQWAEALEAYERQLLTAPDFHALHLEMARAHLQLGQPRRALQHLETASEQAPTGGLRQRYQAKLQALRRAG